MRIYDTGHTPERPRVLLKELSATRAAGGEVAWATAEILSDLSRETLKAAQAMWSPLKAALRLRLEADGAAMPESISWDWPLKTATELPAVTETHAVHLASSSESECEGIIMLTSEPVRRLQEPGCATYINYIEAAPWNLAMYVGRNRMRYSGVGVGLLRLAISRSLDMGCQGVLALHSVPEEATLRFYRNLHFVDLGFDQAAQYQYLELPASAALSLLTGVTA